MTPGKWLLALAFAWVVGNVLALAIARAAGRRRPTSPAETQATQDADDESVALTNDTRWQEPQDGFYADIDTYRGGHGMPGDRRTTWTREDYTS